VAKQLGRGRGRMVKRWPSNLAVAVAEWKMLGLAV